MPFRIFIPSLLPCSIALVAEFLQRALESEQTGVPVISCHFLGGHSSLLQLAPTFQLPGLQPQRFTALYRFSVNLIQQGADSVAKNPHKKELSYEKTLRPQVRVKPADLTCMDILFPEAWRESARV